MTPSDAIERAGNGLRRLQEPDGRFEGVLTSNAYPTLACMVVELLRNRPLDAGYRRWLRESRLPDGRYPLDPERQPSDEATRFARAILTTLASDGDLDAAALLADTPDTGWRLWLVTVLGALLRQYDWNQIPPPRSAEVAGRIAGALLPILPKTLIRRIKPPDNIAPPVSLFEQKAFARLFVAEQYTLAPMLFLIEAHTRKRPPVLRNLVSWILARQAVDGSWFCVTFITALAALALIVASDVVPEERTALPLARALEWLYGTRNDDGGHREAVSLNVWDTSLAVLSLLASGVPANDMTILRATDWLVETQNRDGGWAFHGLRGPGLPSDADDTALATRALLETSTHTVAAERGVSWLRSHQAKDGSWSTYRPGAGDIGCVSVTAHAMETMLVVGDVGSVRRACRWLVKTQSADGSWDDLWLARRVYGTSCALIALARSGGRPQAISRGVSWLRRARNPDGGWGETQRGIPAPSTAEQTAFAVHALRSCGEHVEDGVRWLVERQRADGGWEPSPVGIYWEVIGGYANPINAWVFPILALCAVSS
jgi:squalene-hopene/tetraprenyl-beta-curcumene cyclase